MHGFENEPIVPMVVQCDVKTAALESEDPGQATAVSTE
jgi:hypothetical protein